MSVVGSDCCRAQPPLSQEEPCFRERLCLAPELTGQIEEEADLKPCQTPAVTLAPWITALAPVCEKCIVWL